MSRLWLVDVCHTQSLAVNTGSSHIDSKSCHVYQILAPAASMWVVLQGVSIIWMDFGVLNENNQLSGALIRAMHSNRWWYLLLAQNSGIGFESEEVLVKWCKDTLKDSSHLLWRICLKTGARRGMVRLFILPVRSWNEQAQADDQYRTSTEQHHTNDTDSRSLLVLDGTIGRAAA